jgi:hypothetical protein
MVISYNEYSITNPETKEVVAKVLVGILIRGLKAEGNKGTIKINYP